MMVTLVGMGLGTLQSITIEGQAAIQNADFLLGAQRLLDAFEVGFPKHRYAATKPQALLDALQASNAASACVLYSGDTGFYSGTHSLLPLLREAGIDYRILPGLSSVQYFAAKLETPWQNWTLHSAHGKDCDAVCAVMQDRDAFFLTGGTSTPTLLCRQLDAAGLGALQVCVGEQLSYATERILHGTAAHFATLEFAPLSVLLVKAAPRPFPIRSAGLPDEAFLRGAVPMTKQEVRAAILSKLAVHPGETLWDVGAGTGSVSVELALAAQGGRVFAVEYKEEACRLIRKNREQFGAWNLTLIPGTAPAVLDALPTPDAVFIGGSMGNLSSIVDAVLRKNPAVRLCISAIALETLSLAIAALTAHGLEVKVTQLSVHRTKPAASLHLLMAQNSIFLITGGCDA